MELIELKILVTQHGNIPIDTAGIESSLEYNRTKTIHLNPKHILYKTEEELCIGHYEPHKPLGNYFEIVCDNGLRIFLPASEFSKI